MIANFSILSNLKIGTRLAALFGFLSTLLVATGLFALYIVVDAVQGPMRTNEWLGSDARRAGTREDKREEFSM